MDISKFFHYSSDTELGKRIKTSLGAFYREVLPREPFSFGTREVYKSTRSLASHENDNEIYERTSRGLKSINFHRRLRIGEMATGILIMSFFVFVMAAMKMPEKPIHHIKNNKGYYQVGLQLKVLEMSELDGPNYGTPFRNVFIGKEIVPGTNMEGFGYTFTIKEVSDNLPSLITAVSTRPTGKQVGNVVLLILFGLLFLLTFFIVRDTYQRFILGNKISKEIKIELNKDNVSEREVKALLAKPDLAVRFVKNVYPKVIDEFISWMSCDIESKLNQENKKLTSVIESLDNSDNHIFDEEQVIYLKSIVKHKQTKIIESKEMLDEYKKQLRVYQKDVVERADSQSLKYEKIANSKRILESIKDSDKELEKIDNISTEWEIIVNERLTQVATEGQNVLDYALGSLEADIEIMKEFDINALT